MTYRLEICCSIQLSYGTIATIFFAVQICKNLSKSKGSVSKLATGTPALFAKQIHSKYQKILVSITGTGRNYLALLHE
jgi:hypothetical protein